MRGARVPPRNTGSGCLRSRRQCPGHYLSVRAPEVRLDSNHPPTKEKGAYHLPRFPIPDNQLLALDFGFGDSREFDQERNP